MKKAVSGMKVSWREKIAFGVGPIGKNVSSSMIGFLSDFLMQTKKIDSKFLGIMFFAARIWDGVNDLMMGKFIDNTKSKYGKFRPWILAGAITNAIVVVFLFWNPSLGQVAKYIYVAASFLLYDLTFTMIDVGYWAMIPALSLDEKERGVIALIPRLMGAVGGLIGNFTFNIVEKLGKGDNAKGFLFFAILSGIAYIATTVVCVSSVKEHVTSLTVQEKFSFIRAFKILFRNKQALTIVIIMVLFNVACNLTDEVSLFYFKYVLKLEKQFGKFKTIISATRGIGLFAYSPISRKIGRRRMSFIAYLTPIFGYILMMLFNKLSPGNLTLFIIAAATTYITYGCMDVMQGIMLADAVDYGEWSTGERNEGIIFSMLTFLSKIAKGIQSLIMFSVFSIVGFKADATVAPSAKAVAGINFVMYIIPPVLLVCAFLVHKYKYKLEGEYMSNITKELTEKRLKRQEMKTAENDTEIK